MTSQLYVNDLSLEFWKFTDVYHEGTCNGVFIEGVGARIQQNLGHHWAISLTVDLTDIRFWAASQLVLQKWFQTVPQTSYEGVYHGKSYNKKLARIST